MVDGLEAVFVASFRYSLGILGILGLCPGPLTVPGYWFCPADGARNLAFSFALSLLPPVNLLMLRRMKPPEASAAEVGVTVTLFVPP